MVLVFERHARHGAAPGDIDGVEVVHATGEADDTIVSIVDADRGTIVVTADRQLAERVRAVGGDVRGPSWLLEQLAD